MDDYLIFENIIDMYPGKKIPLTKICRVLNYPRVQQYRVKTDVVNSNTYDQFL